MLRDKIYAALPSAGALAALSAVLLAIMAGQGTRWEFWHFSVGLGLLKFSVYAACIAGSVSLAGIVGSLLLRNRSGLLLGLAGFVLSGLLVAVPAYWLTRARQLPAIHDITTDPDDPPGFDAILPLRHGASNPAAYGGPQIAAQQRRAYPDIAPLILRGTRDEVFERAFFAARKMRWRVVAADRSRGIIEAVDSTWWFGFRDDIVIRLRGEGDNNTRVDVRSVSRVGVSDIGTNAGRIRGFLHILGRQRI